jgi:hypothetical protein
MASEMASELELASLSSCVPEMEIRRFGVSELPRSETCLRSYDTRRAHRYLATRSNYSKGHGRLEHP